jgi:hypothetical protein
VNESDFPFDLSLAAPPRALPRPLPDTPAPEWHALSWRPAGSASLAERWLRAGDGPKGGVPPKLKRRR